jgi:hypothetical protein
MSWGSFSAALAQHLHLLLGSLSKNNFALVAEEVDSLTSEYGSEAHVVLLRHLLEALDPHAPSKDESRALKLQLLGACIDALLQRPVSAKSPPSFPPPNRSTQLGHTQIKCIRVA